MLAALVCSATMRASSANSRIDLLAQDIGVGLRLGRLQAEQHVALFDLLGLLDEDFPDDAAFEMLHHLVIA